MDIGFIGVGQMGGRMAKNLLKAGYELTVHDLNRDAARSLLDQGAKWTNTPKAVAESCSVVISMLPRPLEVEQEVFGYSHMTAGRAGWGKGTLLAMVIKYIV